METIGFLIQTEKDDFVRLRNLEGLQGVDKPKSYQFVLISQEELIEIFDNDGLEYENFQSN